MHLRRIEMKKIAIFMAVAAAAVTSAHSAIFVAWNGPSGFTMADGTTPLVGGVAQALVQLVYTPDAIAGSAEIGGTATGDTVLDQQLIDEALTGNAYGAGFSFVYGPSADLIGFLYVRVFEAGTSIGNVNVGDFYYTGPLFATVNNPGPPATPNDVNAGAAFGGDGDSGTFRLTQQVVPEPSVLALAALGAAVVAVRRFRRS
jgi:hypothetical protein